MNNMNCFNAHEIQEVLGKEQNYQVVHPINRASFLHLSLYQGAVGRDIRSYK